MARSLKEIEETLIQTTLRRDQVNYLGPGSVLSSIVKDLAIVIQGIELNAEAGMKSVLPSTANNNTLNTLAAEYGVSPEKDKRAYSLKDDKNIWISTKNGDTLETVLADNDISILGLRVTSKDKAKTYIVTGYTGDLSTTGAYLTATATAGGAGFNVGKGELRYFEKPFKNLQVINKFSILNGQNKESPDSIREKILLKLEGNKNNSNQIRTTLDTIKYIGKYSVFNNYGGGNNLLICAQPISGVTLPFSLSNEIKSKILPLVNPGTNLIVKDFDVVEVNIKTKIVSTNGDGASLVGLVEQTIVNYFNKQEGGMSLNIAALEMELKKIPNLKLISRNNNTLQEVEYVKTNGTASFYSKALPSSVIEIDPTQIIILNSLTINYE